jgi:hypothetical protein
VVEARATVNDSETFPCGCRIGGTEGSFVITPCSPTCEVFAYAHTEARKRGIPIQEIDMGHKNPGGFQVSCSECEKTLSGFTGPRGAMPEAGSLSICVYCGAVGVFTDTGIRKPTALEGVRIAADSSISNMVRTVKQAAARRGGI